MLDNYKFNNFLNYIYFNRLYRNTLNLSIVYKFNLNNFYFLPAIKSVFIDIFLHNLYGLSDLRIFKSFYLIIYLTGFKPYLSGIFSRYSSSKKIFSSNITFFLFGNATYKFLLKFSKFFFFKLKEFFFYENVFNFFFNSFFFTISNINLWKEFESNPIFFKWNEVLRFRIFFCGNNYNLNKVFLSGLKFKF